MTRKLLVAMLPSFFNRTGLAGQGRLAYGACGDVPEHRVRDVHLVMPERIEKRLPIQARRTQARLPRLARRLHRGDAAHARVAVPPAREDDAPGVVGAERVLDGAATCLGHVDEEHVARDVEQRERRGEQQQRRRHGRPPKEGKPPARSCLIRTGGPTHLRKPRQLPTACYRSLCIP